MSRLAGPLAGLVVVLGAGPPAVAHGAASRDGASVAAYWGRGLRTLCGLCGVCLRAEGASGRQAGDEATRWVGRDVVIAGVDALSDDQFYRAMD